jgi:hypothetical protein
MVNIFFTKEATLKVDAAGDVSISASTVLDTAFASSTAFTTQAKDVSIDTKPVTAAIIHLLGTTSSFQNQEIEEKPPELVEISGTAVVPGDEVMELEIFGSGTSAGGTHTTYQIGKATTTKLAVLINADDGTDEVNYAGTNMLLIEYSPKTTGADGHFEFSFKFTCLARDFYGPQFKD